MQRLKSKKFIVLIVLLLVLCCFCSLFASFLSSGDGADAPTPENTAMPAKTVPALNPVVASPESTVTNTPAPTFTAPPTDTPQPTLTPLPTETPAPTNTPEPTAVPTLMSACTCQEDNLNCGDFVWPADAQRCFEYCVSLGLGDVYGLDRDSDGNACEFTGW